MNELKIFDYKDSPIAFELKDGRIMANGTDMAKRFNKRVSDWVNLKQTTELTNSLSAKTGIPVTELMIVNQGGNNQGTWLHEDLALVLAQWLSSDFYLWCNDRIKELMRYGMTATPDTIEKMIADPDFAIQLLTNLKEERSKRIKAESTVAILTHTNKTYTCTEVAKELGMKSANELNMKLQKLGIQYKQNNTWIPYSKYSSLAWFDIKQEVLDNGHVIYHRRITGLGREAIVELFNKK